MTDGALLKDVHRDQLPPHDTVFSFESRCVNSEQAVLFQLYKDKSVTGTVYALVLKQDCFSRFLRIGIAKLDKDNLSKPADSIDRPTGELGLGTCPNMNDKDAENRLWRKRLIKIF
jgi:hypothetical protein